VKGKEYRARFPIMTSWPAGQTNKRQNKKKVLKKKKKKENVFVHPSLLSWSRNIHCVTVGLVRSLKSNINTERSRKNSLEEDSLI
jgi:hypothetical protein